MVEVPLIFNPAANRSSGYPAERDQRADLAQGAAKVLLGLAGKFVFLARLIAGRGRFVHLILHLSRDLARWQSAGRPSSAGYVRMYKGDNNPRQEKRG